MKGSKGQKSRKRTTTTDDAIPKKVSKTTKVKSNKKTDRSGVKRKSKSKSGVRNVKFPDEKEMSKTKGLEEKGDQASTVKPKKRKIKTNKTSAVKRSLSSKKEQHTKTSRKKSVKKKKVVNEDNQDEEAKEQQVSVMDNLDTDENRTPETPKKRKTKDRKTAVKQSSKKEQHRKASKKKKKSVKKKKEVNKEKKVDEEAQEQQASVTEFSDTDVEQTPETPTKKSNSKRRTAKSPKKRKKHGKVKDPVTNANSRGNHHFQLLLDLLKECLLDRRWGDAGSVLASMCMYPAPPHYTTGKGMPGHELIWTCGIEVTYNHADTSYTDISLFHRKRQQLDHRVSQHQSLLEHVYYLLSEQKYKEAHEVITTKVHFKKSKNVLSSASTQQRYAQDTLAGVWRDLVPVYTGLIEYMLWYQAGSQHSHCSRADANKHWENAVTHLGTVSDRPGVWDVFVTKHIELLCNKNLLDEAVTVARKYAETNPDNPNAHKYLYHVLKSKKGSNPDALAEILKNVVEKNPSDELVLDYANLVHGEEEQPQIALLFNMLDYACWRNILKPWQTLEEELESIYLKQYSRTVVHECWSERKTWWPDYQFDPLQTKALMQHDRELAVYKAQVAIFLMGPDCEYVEEVMNTFKDSRFSSFKLKAFNRINATKKVYQQYQRSVKGLC